MVIFQILKDEKSLNFDVSLLQTEKSLNSLEILSLNSKLNYENLKMAGWGSTKTSFMFSEKLKIFDAQIDQICPNLLFSLSCLKIKGDFNPCHGDSGSPIYNSDNQIIGIVSHGFSCDNSSPVVFVKTAEIANFIAENAPTAQWDDFPRDLDCSFDLYWIYACTFLILVVLLLVGLFSFICRAIFTNN
ncbi:hypothetical protein MHBO_005295 [Bonamia ostreae]|uniref:Peptidase S1 domain-containing protein n=1 Tax=Bonamia ostreae TaxID=126728 RepID=A0ABV2AJD6_9EUKA